MKLKLFILLLLPITIMFGMVACEGPEGEPGAAGTQGPVGPDGPEGPEGPGFPMYTYLGDNLNTCGHCHSDKADGWPTTHHSEAYSDLVAENQHNNPYCLQCHTVGFDAPVNYGDTVLTSHGTDHNGFDDYWPPESAEDSTRISHLGDVQCEACHGPMGPTIYNHKPEMSFATGVFDGAETSLCAKCHTGQIEEWYEAGHGNVLEKHGFADLEEFTDEFGRSSCNSCHTSEGFIVANDADYAGGIEAEHQNLIGCVTCHDPHEKINEHQLRSIADQEVLYNINQPATFTGWGTGQVCAQCHHARRDVNNVNGQIARGSAHMGPHGSPQMDMFMGTGSYEIANMTYERDGHWNAGIKPENGCVTCHMANIPEHGRDHFIHTFEPNLVACQECHGGAEDFDINGRVTEINDLLLAFENRLTAASLDEAAFGDTTRTSREQREAYYAYLFVLNDGSHGAHNYNYAKSLMENAITHWDANP